MKKSEKQRNDEIIDLFILVTDKLANDDFDYQQVERFMATLVSYIAISTKISGREVVESLMFKVLSDEFETAHKELSKLIQDVKDNCK